MRNVSGIDEEMEHLSKLIGIGIGLFLAYALITTGLKDMFKDGIFGIIVCAVVVGFGVMIAVSVFKDKD